MEETESESPEPQPKSKPWILYVAGFLALVFAWGYFSYEDDGGGEFGAQVACEDRVRGMLKSPGTARFGNPKRTEMGSSWLISGHVDSQNSFGGVVRSNYSCLAEYVGDDIWEAGVTAFK